MKPWLLDLFGGAGGAAVGYHRAGFDVVGVDHEPHADYPFRLIIADALDVLADADFCAGFDVIHASPPCRRYSSITPAHTRDSQPDLIGPVISELRRIALPWVLENVPRSPVPGPVMLCGKAMGLPNIRRHRLFSSSVALMSPGCACDRQPAYGVYGDHGDTNPPRTHSDGYRRWGKARDVAHAREVMGIDWMTDWNDMADAIPPAYTEYIGQQLLAQLEVA